jgi:hypothetical protein
MLADPHRAALEVIADRLQGSQVPWAVSGSVALVLQGVPVSCGDLDLVTTADGAIEVASRLNPEMTEAVASTTRGSIRGQLGRARVGAVELEILGDVQNLVAGSWTEPPCLQEAVVRVPLGDRELPVIDLAHLRAAYLAMGRREKVALIDAARLGKGASLRDPAGPGGVETEQKHRGRRVIAP